MNIRTSWMTNNSLFGDNYLKDLQIDSAKKRFDKQRYESNEGYQAIIDDGTSEYIVIQNYTNVLNEDKEDIKVHFALDSKVKRGSVVKIVSDNRVFLVVSAIKSNNAYLSASMIETNNTLSFYKNYILFQIPCIFSDKTLDMSENKFMNLPAGHYSITIPAGTITKSDTNLRFILNDAAYNIVGISNATNGLVKIEVKDDEFVADDNRELQIANFYNNQVVREITILNGTLIKKFFGDEPFQLNIECKENGVVVENPSVTYQTNDLLVCTVSSTGLVTLTGTGVTDIRVIFGAAESSITIESNVTSQDSYNIVFTPSDTTIKANRSLILNAIVTNNGVNDPLKQVGFIVTNSDSTQNQYVTYTTDNNRITITAGAIYNKYITIKIYILAYPEIYVERQIKIISLI